ncbi:MAG: PASTA domain-containing protein [Synergistaceae bacterium]|nr:PASTA domain-containing protein [Synergistaceae bacterium]
MGNYKGFISVICVIIMLVCGFLGIKSIFYSSADNVVPDVVGMKSQEAVTAMKNAGFMPFIDRVTASAPSDTVVSQSFEAGTRQTKGTTIYLRVSFGGASMEIPDVTGMTLDDALKKLQDIGLTVDEIKKMPNKEHPVGVVFAQNPSSPQTVDTSTKITLLVASQGDETSLVQIPNVIGKSQAEATSMIESAGLKLGEIKLKHSETVADGIVVSQTPNSGLNVSTGTTVSIDISSAAALDDLSIEKETPERKTAPIKRVVVEPQDDFEKEVPRENVGRKVSQTGTTLQSKTNQLKESSKQKTEKKQDLSIDSKKLKNVDGIKATKNKSSKEVSAAVNVNAGKSLDKKKSDSPQQAKETSKQSAKQPEIRQETKAAIPVVSDKRPATKAAPIEEKKQTAEQPIYTGKVAKIRYQTPPITGNSMSLRIVIHDDNGTRVLREGPARSLEYISMNARYSGTAKITIYLGGEEVWHDKYN